MPAPTQTPVISVSVNNGGVSAIFTGTVVSTAANNTGINFYRNTTNSTTGGTLVGSIPSGSSALSYFDTSAPIATQVWYYAKYFNASGEGPVSNTQAATVPAAVPATTQSQYSNVVTVTPNYIPAACTNLVGTAGAGVSNLVWTNPTQLGSVNVLRRNNVQSGPVNGWTVIANLPAGTPGTPSTVPNSYSDTTVVNGTTYDYDVQALP